MWQISKLLTLFQSRLSEQPNFRAVLNLKNWWGSLACSEASGRFGKWPWCSWLERGGCWPVSREAETIGCISHDLFSTIYQSFIHLLILEKLILIFILSTWLTWLWRLAGRQSARQPSKLEICGKIDVAVQDQRQNSFFLKGGQSKMWIKLHLFLNIVYIFRLRNLQWMGCIL